MLKNSKSQRLKVKSEGSVRDVGDAEVVELKTQVAK